MRVRFESPGLGEPFFSIEPELQAGAPGFRALPRIPADPLPDRIPDESPTSDEIVSLKDPYNDP
jgi:hypothetical protein